MDAQMTKKGLMRRIPGFRSYVFNCALPQDRFPDSVSIAYQMPQDPLIRSVSQFDCSKRMINSGNAKLA